MRWIIGALLLFSTACGVAAPSLPPTAPLKLKVADGVTPVAALPQSILSLAAQHGFFSKNGLDVEVQDVNGTPSIIAAMRTDRKSVV